MAEGVSPRKAALDIVGRINKATGRREGGIIGLDSGRIDTIERNTARLRSGDPEKMRKYLKLKSRDKRLDKLVEAAIESGKPVSASDTRKIIGRMADSLLRDRGETIARTELLGALHSAQDEGMLQLIDSGKINAGQVKRIWDAAEDGDTRDSHRAMDGQERSVSGYFTSGAGFELRHPGDPTAPAKERINCRCRVTIDIDFLSELGPGD